MSGDDLNANEIECAHCGEQFYYELTRCPNCGVNVYFPEFNEDSGPESPASNATSTIANAGNTLLVVAAGVLITAAIVISPFFFIQRSLALQAGSKAEAFVVFSLTALGSVLAGFVAARYSKHHPAAHGMLVGLASTSVAAAIYAYGRDLAAAPLITPTTLIGWALVILAGYLGARLAISRTRQAAVQQLFGAQPSEADLYQELLTKARFDEALANRLIAYEGEQAPNASRNYLIKRAIERWERDSR